MKYPTVSVNGVSVRVDDYGRYSLNDLHASAVGSGQAKENQGPSQFLRSKKVKYFVQTLARMQKCILEENQPVKVINGGVNQGVWPWKLLQYAMPHGSVLSLRSGFTKPFSLLFDRALMLWPA